MLWLSDDVHQQLQGRLSAAAETGRSGLGLACAVLRDKEAYLALAREVLQRSAAA